MKKNSSKTPVQSAKQTRTSREQVSSRSVSQLDRLEDRPKTSNTNLVLSEEQQENRKLFFEKAQINVENYFIINFLNVFIKQFIIFILGLSNALRNGRKYWSSDGRFS